MGWARWHQAASGGAGLNSCDGYLREGSACPLTLPRAQPAVAPRKGSLPAANSAEIGRQAGLHHRGTDRLAFDPDVSGGRGPAGASAAGGAGWVYLSIRTGDLLSGYIPLRAPNRTENPGR